MVPKKRTDGKKSMLPAVIVAAVILLSALSDTDAVELVAVLILLAIPVSLVVAVFLIVKRAKAAQPDHSHDRIDHRSDLKINPNTGRVEQKPMQNTRHTPQEHWKKQLDGLLANGTIDRSEYRAMMNRKF